MKKMKKIILSLFVIAVALASCNSEKKETSITTVEPIIATELSSDVTDTLPSETSIPVPVSTQATEANQISPNSSTVEKFSIQQIVTNYLALKDALTKDNAKGAANAGRALYADFKSSNGNFIEGKNKKVFLDISDDAKEHAEHIADNGSNIEHQREHFALLSKDMNDLVTTFGSTTKLYQDYCPMYNDGKGAYWISENKEIKNPYYGTGMLTCGSVKKTY